MIALANVRPVPYFIAMELKLKYFISLRVYRNWI